MKRNRVAVSVGARLGIPIGALLFLLLANVSFEKDMSPPIVAAA